MPCVSRLLLPNERSETVTWLRSVTGTALAVSAVHSVVKSEHKVEVSQASLDNRGNAMISAPSVAPRTTLALVLVVLIGLAIHWSIPMRQDVALPPTTEATPAWVRQSSTFTLSYDGVGPTAISFTWTQSSDPCFVSYTLQYSSEGPNGTWTTLVAIQNVTSTSYLARDLVPATTYWWHVVYSDSVSCSIISLVSNTLQVTQAAAAALTATNVTPGSALISWTNDARYGGQLIFRSYTLFASESGGPWSVVANISSASTMTYAASGLTLDREYAYFLTTLDGCSCGGPSVLSNSNSVGFHTPLKTSVLLVAQPASADTEQAVNFTCTPPGIGWLDFHWTYGDGSDAWTYDNGTGDGRVTRHSYSSVGTMVASCWVNDRILNTEIGTGYATVGVSSAPSVDLTISANVLDVGHSVVLRASPSGGPGGFSYSWAGQPSRCGGLGSASLSCTPTVAGTYNVSVTVTDPNGGTASDLVTLVVHEAPGVVLDATPSILLLGQSITLNATASGGFGGFTYRWSGLPPGCSATSDVATLSCQPALSGTYNVTLDVTDSIGGGAQSWVFVTVNPSLLGMPLATGYGILAGIAAVFAAVVIGVLWWSARRGRAPPPPEHPHA